jgi:hypothetical protein
MGMFAPRSDGQRSANSGPWRDRNGGHEAARSRPAVSYSTYRVSVD